jgi:hypothetical protein
VTSLATRGHTPSGRGSVGSTQRSLGTASEALRPVIEGGSGICRVLLLVWMGAVGRKLYGSARPRRARGGHRASPTLPRATGGDERSADRKRICRADPGHGKPTPDDASGATGGTRRVSTPEPSSDGYERAVGTSAFNTTRDSCRVFFTFF